MSQEQIFLVPRQNIVILPRRIDRHDQRIARMLSDCEMISEFEALLHYALKRERKRKKREKRLA